MMARIVKVERAGGRRDRYVLHFEDETELAVTESLVASFRLLPGRELGDEELELLKAELEKQKVKIRAAAMVAARPLSEQELKRKLVQKGSTEQNAEEAVEWLEGLGAVNDLEYARSLVRHYSAKGYGRAKIRDEFWKRGIPHEIWDEALAEYSLNEESISRFIEARLRNGDRREIKRVSDALYRRGFSWDEIRSALNKYVDDLPEE